MFEDTTPFEEPDEVPDGYHEVARLRVIANEEGNVLTDLQVKHLAPQQVVQVLRMLADDIEESGGTCDCGRPECEERKLLVEAERGFEEGKL